MGGKSGVEPFAALVFTLGVSALVIGYITGRVHAFWLWLFVGLEIDLLCHELGHLLFAILGSIPIRLIALGVGPVVFRCRFSETWLELRAWPWSAHVSTYPVLRYRWHWWALFLLGGILGNAAAVCLLLGLNAVGAIPDKMGNFIGPVLAVQVLSMLGSVVPFPGGAGRIDTDGMQLLRMFRQPRAKAAELARQACAAYVSQYYTKGDVQFTTSPALTRILYHAVELQAGKDTMQESCEALVRELKHAGLAREERLWVLDALVTTGIVSRAASVRPHLDTWSRLALELGPDLPTLQGSRGAALVELGHYDEGKALLAPLATASGALPTDAFMSRAFLALAEHGLGNREVAQQSADAARTAAETIEKTWPVRQILARLDADMPPAK